MALTNWRVRPGCEPETLQAQRARPQIGPPMGVEPRVENLTEAEVIALVRRLVGEGLENVGVMGEKLSLTESNLEIAASTEALVLPAGAAIVRITKTTGTPKIGGIVAPKPGERSDIVFRNPGAASAEEWLHESIGAEPANRIHFTTGEPAKLRANETMRLYYDFASSRWTDVGTAGAISRAGVKTVTVAPAEPAAGAVTAAEAGAVTGAEYFRYQTDGVTTVFKLLHKLGTKRIAAIWQEVSGGSENHQIPQPENSTLFTNKTNEAIIEYSVAPAAGKVYSVVLFG